MPIRTLFALTLLAAPALAQDGPPPEVRRAISQVVDMLRSTDDAALTRFGAETLTPAYRAALGDGLTRHLRSLREAARPHAGPGAGIGVEQEESGDGLILLFGEPAGVRFRLRLDGSRVSLLEMAGGQSGGGQPSPPAAVSGPPATRERARPYHVRFLTNMGSMALDSALNRLERAHFSQAYLASTTRAERADLVTRIRRAAAAATDIRAGQDGDGVQVRLGAGEASLAFRFTYDDAPPFGITSLTIVPLPPLPGRAAAAPVTWDGLAARIAAAEAAGISGQIIARRAGREVLRRTLGVTDRGTRRPTPADAIYCIGSTPIDFTATAARLLAERGRLDLDAPITRWFSNVPADRAMLTPRMILEGRSGLPQFHHTDSDWDNDLAYIDRETAVRRIMQLPLLSTPGTERAPSHTAFGLLAAIVEVASGMSYQDFLRREIFQPLGMTRTGFYGDSLGLPLREFATGYGRRSQGTPNVPPNWGPTSWLVMGSGGMVSTLGDLDRYYQGMANGTLFGGRRQPQRVGAIRGGSDRGFIFTRAINAGGDELLFISNTEGDADMESLLESLVGLVMGSR